MKKLLLIIATIGLFSVSDLFSSLHESDLCLGIYEVKKASYNMLRVNIVKETGYPAIVKLIDKNGKVAFWNISKKSVKTLGYILDFTYA